LDRCSHNTIYNSPGVEAGASRDGDPAEGKQRGDKDDRDQTIQGPKTAICEVVGHNAAKDSNTVEGYEEADGFGVWEADYRTAERGQIVEGEVDAPEILLQPLTSLRI
jgi:hypothetical protein